MFFKSLAKKVVHTAIWRFFKGLSKKAGHPDGQTDTWDSSSAAVENIYIK